ncbi:MAG: glycosyltransferase family 4 protein [Actinobacteria bacterium]|nr:glycosyltransferase family 4 protein [Actinomycetota bacterium]
MRLGVVAPHFEPDLAPTGEVITRIVQELGRSGHEIQVVTSFPFYKEHRVESAFAGRLVRTEDTPWGRIVRVHPFPGSDKSDLMRRAASFLGFSALATTAALLTGRFDCVLALSPPLTLGVTGWLVAKRSSCPLVFTIHDVYPDVVVELGRLTNPGLIKAASALERFCYERADAVTVLSEELRKNVARKTSRPSKVRVITNFVDTDWITPGNKHNAYREEHGLDGKTVVMYAGNVGLSQSLDLVLDAARALASEKDVCFVVNGQGSARPQLEAAARTLPNVCFVDMQPVERLPELLNAADIHLVPLKRGLARSSVPSKTYSILASGRALIASVDQASEVARLVERSGGGVVVPPEDSGAFVAAVEALVRDEDLRLKMGAAGRRYVEGQASPAVIAQAYENLFFELLRA